MKLFNNEDDRDKQREIIKTLFGSTDEKLTMNPRFVCDYGSNIYVGENFYANYNCTMLDVCEITLATTQCLDQIVNWLTPLHPLDAKERISGLEYGAPITIGDNAWFGGSVSILPGVTLGDNVVVGAGAVVTKSFADNVVLAGNPAKIIKNA